LGRRTSRTRYGRVRIIGGRWRGRRIAFPEVEGLRPTPDRARETLFNWLAPYLPGARVLDLYAGSGILGLEALSRGASSLVAVDSSRLVAAQLRESARQLGAEGLEVVAMDVPGFLNTAHRDPFDVVFLDPPYAGADYEGLCAALDAAGLVGPDGFVYLEFSTPRSSTFAAPDGWKRHRSSRAGHLTYQLWRPAGGPD